MKLNLGSRDRSKVGFVNMDIDDHPGVDIVGDVSDLSRFADGSVETILASNILEHFPHPKVRSVLAEWVRVLAPGGLLYLSVPDFRRTVDIYLHMGLQDWVQNFLMGDQGYATAFHYCLFDEDRLTSLMESVGLKDILRLDFMPFGEDCANMLSNLDGKPVCLNMRGVK